MTPPAYGAVFQATGITDPAVFTGRPPVNADLLFRRLWYADDTQGKDKGEDREDPQTAHLRAVVDAAGRVPSDLLGAVHVRRRAAAAALAASHRPEWTVKNVVITPCWRVVVGHGETTVHETALTFSPTYGVPMWPGSSLKGVAAAQARATCPEATVARLFGSPRPVSRERDTHQADTHQADTHQVEAHKAAVTVLDALPLVPQSLAVDVLTPHVQPYYQDVNERPKQVSTPPAEYHNPAPVRFLAVEATPLHTSLIGPAADVEEFFRLLRDGVDDLGLGGKTAAGYGYCTVTEAGA
ncbi:MAG: type III-B CRISPR module RAMP protein Cmr6 [Sciscionella sp.]